MSRSSFTAVAPADVPMGDAPVNPAWVRSGAPRARIGEIARSADGTSVTLIWDCTAGLFDWRFGVDETVHILEGEVAVTGADGVERVLRPGDVAFFPSGAVTLWRVETYRRCGRGRSPIASRRLTRIDTDGLSCCQANGTAEYPPRHPV